MAIIAVAGGSGAVGKTIVEGLVAHGRHKVYVFSRNERPAENGVTYIKVDYSDVEATAKSLEGAQVDTLVSTIGVATPETNEAQKNLVRAASKSSSTRRFVVSGYDMLHLREHIAISPLAKYTFEAVDLLEQTDLEYTRVANGWFLDYYGMPHYKSHLHPWINVINMEKKWAAIPGDGSATANFITTQDMARFVARLMDLDDWDTVSNIVAETFTLNEIVALAEKARGCKFNIAHDSLDKLKSGKISFIEDFPPIGFGDSDEAFYAMLHFQASLGHFTVPNKNTLNDKFPDVKITTAAEVMGTWAGK